MWIEKDMGGRCARGGALSQQVNDGIETLKRNNNFLFSGIGGNLLSEAKKRRCDERLRSLSRSTVLTASTKSGGSAVLTSSSTSAASATPSAWTTSTASTRCWAAAKGAEQSAGKSKGWEAHRCRKDEKGEELSGGGDLFGADNWIDKKNAATCRNDDGGNARNKTWRKLSSSHLTKEPQVTSSRKRPNQPMDKCPTSGSEWKSRNVCDFDGTHYKSTQYLNNSAVYNDSIVNNETVVCQEWPEMSNRGELAAHEGNLEEGRDDPPAMAPLSKKEDHRRGVQNRLTSIQDVIQKDIPTLIKNTVNNHLTQNINKQVQEAIKKNLSNLLHHNGTDISEKKAQKFSTQDVQGQLSDLVDAQMRKNANHIYSTVENRIQQNVNEEIERSTHIVKKQIKQNVTDQIETNLERVYNEVDLKVEKKVSNELAKNMNSVQSNLLQNVNNELKRKVKLIGANVDSQLRVLISSELKRSLDFLHNRINDNMNRELKKCLSIVNRNFDDNFHEHMERSVQIFLKNVCECLSQEIKNNVNVMEKSMMTNWNDHVLEKVTRRTEEAINRVEKAMILMDNTTKRAEEAVGLTKHISEGISSEVRSCFDEFATSVQEGICGELRSGLQSGVQYLSKENEVASVKMTQVICAKVEAATSSELARQMGTLLGGLRDGVRDNLGSMEVALKGSVEATLKRSVETTLKGSLEGTLKRSVETTLKGSLEGTLKRSVETTLKGSLEGTLKRSVETTLKGSLEGTLKRSVETTLKGSLEGTLKRSVETTLKGSLEGTLKRSVETTLKGSLEETLKRSLQTILREELSKTAQMLYTDACEEEAKRSDTKLETVLNTSNKNFHALIKVQRSLSTHLNREMRMVKDMKANMVDVKTFFKTCLTCLEEKLSDAMEKNISAVIDTKEVINTKEEIDTSAVIETRESILSRLDNSFSGMEKLLSQLCEKVVQRVGEANEKYAHHIAEKVGTMASTHQSLMKDEGTATEVRLEKMTQDILHLTEATAQRTYERLRINNEDVLTAFIDNVQREKAHMIMHAEEIMACFKKSIEEHSRNMLDNLSSLLNEKDGHMMEGLKQVRSELDIKLEEQTKQFLSHLDRKINHAIRGRVRREGGTDWHDDANQVQRITLGPDRGIPFRVDKQKRYLIGSDMVENPLGSTGRGEHRERKRGMVREVTRGMKRGMKRRMKHRMKPALDWTLCRGAHGEMDQPNRRIRKSVNKRNPNQPQNETEATRKRKPIYVVNYLRSKNNDLIKVVQHLHEKTRKII
ncbi:hypothetical protein C922_04175 [Plasmodium inui San Antonio 1]|uniref:Uncharacterized protein n=1 Tax=Plasmodium inui San Antonio 1 TaxID=1237626 RepID=W7A187_9APIC|nr:hypothetical protein C922_04175 [Plasmodium inui San Antonio 1]EUD65435.1 hypothetical protein C922_04175 [Plasmodium inui San Antonio 1]